MRRMSGGRTQRTGQRLRSEAVRAAITLAVASFCFVRPAHAEEFTLPGASVARALAPIFANTRIVLDSYSPDESAQSFNNPKGSYIEFAKPLPRYKGLLTMPERGFTFREGDHYDELRYNVAHVNTRSVNVVSVPGGFNLVFLMESAGSEGVWRCTRHWRNGRTATCPDLAAGGQVWARPVEWENPLVVVKLVPTVVSGGLGFRAVKTTLTGRMVMTGRRPDGDPSCGAGADPNTVCGIVARYLSNLNNDRTARLNTEMDDAFDERKVRSVLALAMVAPLRALGVTGRIQQVRMDGKDVVITK